jgi:hypothetical protein
MKPALKPPRSKRLKLAYDKLLSNVAFKISLRLYNMDYGQKGFCQNCVPITNVGLAQCDNTKAGAHTRPLLSSI